MKFFGKISRIILLIVLFPIASMSLYGMDNHPNAMSDQEFDEWLQLQRAIAASEENNDTVQVVQQDPRGGRDFIDLTSDDTNSNSNDNRNNNDNSNSNSNDNRNDNNNDQNNSAVQKVDESSFKTCTICLDDEIKEVDYITLACGHAYCSDCLVGFVDRGLKEKKILHIVCPNTACSMVIDQQKVREIVKNDPTKVAAYLEVTLLEHLAEQPNAKYCPTPNCPTIVLNEIEAPRIITCQGCNHEYCTGCLHLHDNLITCEQAEKNRTQDLLNDEWRNKNTKPCPSCNVRIEKNDGCKYMNCTQCQQAFCWDCLGLYNHLDHECVQNEPAHQVNNNQNNNNNNEQPQQEGGLFNFFAPQVFIQRFQQQLQEQIRRQQQEQEEQVRLHIQRVKQERRRLEQERERQAQQHQEQVRRQQQQNQRQQNQQLNQVPEPQRRHQSLFKRKRKKDKNVMKNKRSK